MSKADPRCTRPHGIGLASHHDRDLYRRGGPQCLEQRKSIPPGKDHNIWFFLCENSCDAPYAAFEEPVKARSRCSSRQDLPGITFEHGNVPVEANAKSHSLLV